MNRPFIVEGATAPSRPTVLLPAARPTIVEGRRIIASRESLNVPTVRHALASITYVLREG